MYNLSAFLNLISNWKTLLGLIFLYLIFAVVLLKNAEERINTLAGKEIGPIDLTFGYNPARTLQMVEDYGAEGRKYYAGVELTIDLIYPVVYAMLFAVLLTIIYRKLIRGPVRYIHLVPFIAMFFDFFENLTIVSMLNHYPEQSYTMASLCEFFKLMKWLVFGVIIFLVVYGMIRLLLKNEKKHAVNSE